MLSVLNSLISSCSWDVDSPTRTCVPFFIFLKNFETSLRIGLLFFHSSLFLASPAQAAIVLLLVVSSYPPSSDPSSSTDRWASAGHLRCRTFKVELVWAQIWRCFAVLFQSNFQNCKRCSLGKGSSEIVWGNVLLCFEFFCFLLTTRCTNMPISYIACISIG